MACSFGTPGYSAGRRGLKFLLIYMLLMVFLTAVICGLFTWGYQRSGLFLTVVGILGGMYLVRRDIREMRADFRNDVRPWFRGAQGEIKAARTLDGLPDAFAVFHDYHPRDASGQLARWNFDHVVVGPTGVFVVETKNYAERQVHSTDVDPRHRENVRQVLRNALEFKETLVRWSGGKLEDVFVVALLVYVQDEAWIEKTREGAVHVIPLKWLESEILRHSERHMDLEKAYRVACALHAQLSPDDQVTFRYSLERFGGQAKVAREFRRGVSAQPKICPRCGAALVRRTARRGERAGKAFLGCSSWSKTGCAFAFNLEE